MSSPPRADPTAGRLLGACLLAGFWVPLAACTYLALTPSPPDPVFQLSDVVLHAFAFTYLTFALGLAYAGMRWRALAGWMLAYGLAIEVIQGLGPARSPELKDLLVDGAGIALGLALLRWLATWTRQTLRSLLNAIGLGGR